MSRLKEKYKLYGSRDRSVLVNVTYGKIYEITDRTTFVDNLGRAELFSSYLWVGENEVINHLGSLPSEEPYTYNTENPDFGINDKPNLCNEIFLNENPKASESQVGGSHYTDMKLQPLEACYQRYGIKGLQAAVHTKIDKYITRKKDNPVEQLKKARHCLDFLIEKVEEDANKS